jgi:hypothetical protein
MFLMELADHLGKTLAETTEGLGPGEFDAWRAYSFLKGPLGIERLGLENSVTRAYSVAVAGAKNVKPDEYQAFPRPDMRTPEEISKEAIEDFLRRGRR